MRGGRVWPVLTVAFCTLPCLGDPEVVSIFGDKQVGGLKCDTPWTAEYCEFTFEALLQVQVGCTVEYDWSFVGCGAQIVEGGNTATPRVRFSETGVCNISMSAYQVETAECPRREWVGTAIYFVVGGPFKVELVNPVPNYSNDYHQGHLPWYLSFHGYDPASTGGAWPDELHAPVGARISAVRPQPQGDRYQTVYEWSYPAGGLWMRNAAQNGTTLAREAEFYARTGSVMGGLEVWLAYAVIYDGVRLGAAWDDSHEVYWPALENYRRFTAHMPKGTDFSSAVPPPNESALRPETPPWPAPPPYNVQRQYWYRLRDHLGFWMPGTWVQERFPNGVPPNWQINGVDDHWTTDCRQPWNGPHVGIFNRRDLLFWSVPEWWPFNDHPNSPLVLPDYQGRDRIVQQYWAGSRDVAVSAPGRLVGVRDMKFWSDQIQHVPERWPAWDWPPAPPPPSPPPAPP